MDLERLPLGQDHAADAIRQFGRCRFAESHLLQVALQIRQRPQRLGIVSQRLAKILEGLIRFAPDQRWADVTILRSIVETGRILPVCAEQRIDDGRAAVGSEIAAVRSAVVGAAVIVPAATRAIDIALLVAAGLIAAARLVTASGLLTTALLTTGLLAAGLIPAALLALALLIPALLAAEMTARTWRDPGEIYQALTEQFGAPVYERIDAPATPEQKAKLAAIRAEDVKATEFAGDPIEGKPLTHAPGGAPLNGVKVVTRRGWFAARPSGTENVYKIYAESFAGDAHLRQIQTEAQELVAGIIGH